MEDTAFHDYMAKFCLMPVYGQKLFIKSNGSFAGEPGGLEGAGEPGGLAGAGKESHNLPRHWAEAAIICHRHIVTLAWNGCIGYDCWSATQPGFSYKSRSLFIDPEGSSFSAATFFHDGMV